MAKLNGPAFLALQVPEPEQSAAFYTKLLGLQRAPKGSPGAVVFDTTPIPFALRSPIGELPAPELRGRGVSIWFGTDSADALHAALVDAGVHVLSPPADGPFGRFFAFLSPDGYTLTAYTRPAQP